MTSLDPTMISEPVVPSRPRRKSTQRPVRLTFDTRRNVQRIIFQVAGTLLVICSAVMWMLPDPAGMTDMAHLRMMKLVASLFFLFCGVALLMRNHDETKPEVHFDARRRELRITQRNNQGRSETILSRGYDTFGAVYISSGAIDLWDTDGTPFLTLPVPDAGMRAELRDQFGPLCA
ncbi:hypothetical protein [Marinibacterium sp. SX1]|uniref:hypothetical protein n=1 Tax=Marinibacterium sp. SX1 TaxID=3388424 RepID=UPI003D16A503